MGSRRSRSMASCANDDGTESRAKPCATVSGLTSLSQACWARETGVMAPSAEPVVSSATTSGQTVANTFCSSSMQFPPRK